MKVNIPVKKNEEYEMTIDNLGVNGEGVGRIDNYTVFVDKALPGEKVKVKIIKVNSNYGVGKLISVIEKSDDRVTSSCAYAHRCGGCQLQHLSYTAQLEYKTKIINEAVKRIGKLDNVNILPTIGMENPEAYRNKAQFPVGFKNDKCAIGFYALRSHDIIDINSCNIQSPLNEKIINIVRDFISKHHVQPYDEETGKGIIRHIVTRIAFNTDEVMVIIVTNGRVIHSVDKLISELVEKVPGISSIVQNINMKKTNVIFGDENILLWGNRYITDTISGIKFRISPVSFYQVNPVQTEKLYKKAIEYAGLTGNETVFDAYCGIGTISLFVAKKAKKVYGIEIVHQAVIDARDNAKINDIDNIEFVEGASEKVIPQLISQGITPDVIMLDPPRKGCDESLIKAIIDAGIKKVVYVSCNPSTLARDLGTFAKAGYSADEIQPVDMFPYTSHVECVVGIQKNVLLNDK